MTFRESRLCKALTASTIILGSAFIVTLLLLLVPKSSYHEVIPPQFNRTIEISYLELYNLTRRAWPQREGKYVDMYTRDGCYLLYSLSDFDKYREYWRKNIHRGYVHGFNDCDDYATIAQGKEREWFTSHLSQSNCGSSFGVISGVLNFIEEGQSCDGIWNGHSMNFFADADLQVWGYDSMADELYLVPLHWCNTTYLTNIFV